MVRARKGVKPTAETIKSLEVKLSDGQKAVFSKHVMAREYFFFESVWEDASPTTLTAYLIANSLGRLGDVETIDTDAILKLPMNDLQLLTESLNEFSQRNGVPEQEGTDAVKLVFGLKKDGKVYDRFVLGRPTIGYDKIETEKRAFTVNQAAAFLAGRQISEITGTDGATISGPISYEDIGSMYLVDVIGLMGMSKVWTAVSMQKARAARNGEK